MEVAEAEEERPRRKGGHQGAAAATKAGEAEAEVATAVAAQTAAAQATKQVAAAPRPGVMRLGAAKRAQAAPRTTAYAAAMLKERMCTRSSAR